MTRSTAQLRGAPNRAKQHGAGGRERAFCKVVTGGGRMRWARRQRSCQRFHALARAWPRPLRTAPRAIRGRVEGLAVRLGLLKERRSDRFRPRKLGTPFGVFAVPRSSERMAPANFPGAGKPAGSVSSRPRRLPGRTRAGKVGGGTRNGGTCQTHAGGSRHRPSKRNGRRVPRS